MFNMSMNDFDNISNELNSKTLLENKHDKHLDSKAQSIFGMILKDKHKALEDMDFLDNISFQEEEQHSKDEDDEDNDNDNNNVNNNCSFCYNTKYHKINSYVILVSSETDSSISMSEIESTNN